MDRHAHVIDVQLMRAVGENLGAAVRGETVILQHMMHDGMLNRCYEETLGVKPFSEFLSRVIEQITFVHPEASILEIGAGTGGATKRILKRIPDRFGHYTFTDISSGFFEKAKSVFSSFVESGRMSFRALDIERDPVRSLGKLSGCLGSQRSWGSSFAAIRPPEIRMRSLLPGLSEGPCPSWLERGRRWWPILSEMPTSRGLSPRLSRGPHRSHS